MIARLSETTSRISLYALLLFVALGLSVGLAGCGGGTEQAQQGDEQQQATSDQGQQQQQQQQQADEQGAQSSDETSSGPQDQETDEGDASPQADQQETSDEQTTTDESEGEVNLVERGRQVAQSTGCLSCHSTDGSQMVGPTWQGAYGHDVTLQNGETVTVDDDYIRESIRDPSAKIVQGFSPAMPAYGESQISEDDLQALVAYIESLSEASDNDSSEGD